MSATMTNIETKRPTSSADGVVWDLTDLYCGIDDPGITRDLDSALQRARGFEIAYRGKKRRLLEFDPAVQLWNRPMLDNLKYGLANGPRMSLDEAIDAAIVISTFTWSPPL